VGSAFAVELEGAGFSANRQWTDSWSAAPGKTRLRLCGHAVGQQTVVCADVLIMQRAAARRGRVAQHTAWRKGRHQITTNCAGRYWHMTWALATLYPAITQLGRFYYRLWHTLRQLRFQALGDVAFETERRDFVASRWVMISKPPAQ
jgi:hypothetical protein